MNSIKRMARLLNVLHRRTRWSVVGLILLVGVATGISGFFSQNQPFLSDLNHGSFASPSDQADGSENSTLAPATLSEILDFYYLPGVIFIDTRAPEHFDYARIKGAINVPPSQMESLSKARVERLRQATSVVVYCYDPSCPTAALVARQLSERGVDNVKVYSNGWAEWFRFKLPTDVSEKQSNR